MRFLNSLMNGRRAMTDRIFLDFWEDVCSHYSYKSATNVRIISLYKNAASDISDNKRMELFDATLTECERFPGLGKFKDICERFLPKNPVSKYKNEEKCFYCEDNGFIYTEGNFAWSCPRCNMGKKFKKQNYPPYDVKFGVEALEALGERNRTHVPPPIEVSKAKFLENIAKWNCRL